MGILRMKKKWRFERVLVRGGGGETYGAGLGLGVAFVIGCTA
jgi:hypothetical protein